MGKVYGVVLAGGIGSRMGNAEKPKQFLEIGSRPVIIHTLEKFVLHPGFDEVLVLSPKAWVSYTRDIIRKYIPSASRIPVLEGGVTRNETIMNAIRYIEEQGDLDEDTHRILEENILYARKYGACDTVIPASDTIVQALDNESISDIPDRKYMYQGQTPQSFHAKKLKETYESLTDQEKNILTDACKIMVLKGEHVHLVLGEVSNIKITYPYDITVAQALLGLEMEG